MIHHLTYCSPNMQKSAIYCRESALEHGCMSSTIYTPEHKCIRSLRKTDKGFDEVMSHERGAGYWAWKPVVIMNHLELIEDGEIVVYTDAGVAFTGSVELLLKDMDGDIMVFGNRWKHTEWCKGYVLDSMGIRRDHEGEQLQASCIILRVNDRTRKFIDTWRKLCSIPSMIDDSLSMTGDPVGFREHRHDQAILTNMAIKENLRFHWWPAPYNVRHKHNYTNTYPVLFWHHRHRNEEW